MSKFFIPVVVALVLAGAGYVYLSKDKSVYNPMNNNTQNSGQVQTEAIQKTGNSDVDAIITTIEQDLSAEATAANSSDADAQILGSDGQQLNNLGNTYENQF